MHQSDNMHDIQWRLRFKYLCANKCTTTAAFQVTSFIWLVSDRYVDHRHIYRYMFITFTYHLQPQATSSSSITQLVWSNLTVLHAALLQTASTDFIPVNEHRLVHGKKRFNVQKANAMFNSNRDPAKNARVVFIPDYYALLHLYNRHNLSLTDSKIH